jgi:hypothetical protein
MKKVFPLILKILGAILIIPASIALILGLWLLITGQDGFSDAAPWWFFLFMVAVVLGLPGLIFLFLARFTSKYASEEK